MELERIVNRWNNDEDYVWSETVNQLDEYGIDKYLSDNGYANTIEQILPDWHSYEFLIFAKDEDTIVGVGKANKC